MSATAVLERPTIVGFEAKEDISKLLDRSNEHGRKHGITEEVINEEIELYRKEKIINI